MWTMNLMILATSLFGADVDSWETTSERVLWSGHPTPASAVVELVHREHEVIVEDGGETVARLDTPAVSRFGPGMCAGPRGWIAGVAVQTGDDVWHLQMIEHDGTQTRVALADEPISAVVGHLAEDHTCVMSVVTQSGTLLRFAGDGRVTGEHDARHPLDDPDELFQGVFLETDGEMTVVGRGDGVAVIEASGLVRKASLAGGEPVGAGVFGSDGLWVLTRGGVLNHISRAGHDVHVVHDGGVASRTGLTVWRDSLVWGDERGRVMQYVDGSARLITARGDAIRRPLIAVDIYDEAAPALVYVTASGTWWASRGEQVDALTRSRRPASSASLWLRAGQPPALALPVSSVSSEMLAFRASPAAWIQQDGTVPMAGWQVRQGRTSNVLWWTGSRPSSSLPERPDTTPRQPMRERAKASGGCVTTGSTTPVSYAWLLLVVVLLGRQVRTGGTRHG